MKREIIDSNNKSVGTLELPDNTPEDIWVEKLSAYKIQPAEDISRKRKLTIQNRKEFADQLLEDFKFKNIEEGINALQTMHLHSKMRALQVTFGGQTFTLDFMNFCISGDIEIAALALMYCDIDDMSAPYHWFNNERRAWLVSKMRNFLGW